MGLERLSKPSKSLLPSNVIGHGKSKVVKSLALSNGKVPYQKPQLKSMAHAVHHVYICDLIWAFCILNQNYYI